MDPARTRFDGAVEGVLGFLTLLDRVDDLVVARTAMAPHDVPEEIARATVAILSAAEPARLHRLGYEVAVVFGYASFERFVRDLIVFVAEAMSDFCPNYKDLPKSMRDHHARLTLRVAGSLSERSAIDGPVLGAMLSKLLDCMGGKIPYALNDSVFAGSQANYRMPVLREALRRVGVEVAEEPTSPELTDLLEGELSGLYASPSSVVNDLADRRNQAAHGGETELLDRPTLRAILRFMRAFADRLTRDVASYLTGELTDRWGTEIGIVEHTWVSAETGQRTICRVRPAVEVRLGQGLIVKGGECRLATLRSIQLSKMALEVAGPSEEAHGFDVGLPVHDGQRLFAVPRSKVETIEGLWVV